MSRNISVIIPTLNEARHLEACVAALVPLSDYELIVVDGGSHDGTTEIAFNLKARLFSTRPCRAAQMNLGANVASNDVFLFLHADTILPHDWKDIVHRTMLIPGTSAGAFEFSLDASSWEFASIEKLANFRSRFFQMPYGDQAIFVNRENFFRIGAFPEISIMEDFAFCQAAKKLGQIRTVSAKAVTSSRRWKERGIIKTTLINQLVIALYSIGVSDRTLRRIYDSTK